MLVEEPIFGLIGGFLFGYLAGKASKFIVKAAVIIVGLFVLGLAFLSYKGWISANWPMIENQTKMLAYNTTIQITNMVSDVSHKFQMSTTTPIAGVAGFAIGFLVGLKH